MNFLKRLFGADPELEKEEEQRFKENLKKLEEQEKKLDDLDKQLNGVEQAAKSKQDTLSTSTVDFTSTVSKSLTPPKDRPAMRLEETDEEEEPERISSELTPTGAHG